MTDPNQLVRLTIVAATLCNVQHGIDAWLRLTRAQQDMWRTNAVKFLDELHAHEWAVIPTEEINDAT